MDYENYMELYEAVYFYGKNGLSETVRKAVIRILVVNGLLDMDGNLSAEYYEILDNITGRNDKHYEELLAKATNESQFFFDSISDLEYEIYSRYNFDLTFETGKNAARFINLADRNVLELGGNSGGFGSAFVTKYENCRYTVVDTEIPCEIGYELREKTGLNIRFIAGDIFDLKVDGIYDVIIMMNLLHDFDDAKCAKILSQCVKYCNSDTKFIIIEDILSGEFDPPEVVMHGLRLSAECRGGKQRTVNELSDLFSGIGYAADTTIRLDEVHSIVCFTAESQT